MESSNDGATDHNDPSNAEQQHEQGQSIGTIAPIHWQHRRYESYVSIGHSKPAPIALEDNTEEVPDAKSPLWAKAVAIDGFVLISGGLRGVGDYTIWNCKIDTLDVSSSLGCRPGHLCSYIEVSVS